MTDLDTWLEERDRLLRRLVDFEPAHYSIHKPEACLTLKIAAPEELPVVHRIIHEAFAEYIGVLDPPASAATATLEDFRRSLPEGGAVLGLTEDRGVAAAQFRLREDYLYVGRLAVLPDQRSRGVASRVLHYMDEIACCLDRRLLRLGTRRSLPRNVALYRRNGYEIEAITPFPNGSDSIVWLAKRLP